MWSRRQKNAQTQEEQLAVLRRKIEGAEAELVEREADLVELRVEMSAFQLKYDLGLGRKLDELDEVEAAVDRCKRRIEEYRQWRTSGRPKTRSGDDYIPVEEQYRRAWQEPLPPGPSYPPPPTDRVTENKIKILYRQLSRRFHPDLTQDPEERAWRTEMMTAINAAYTAQSLTELQALAARPERSIRSGKGADRQRLAALRDRLEYLERRLAQVSQEIHDLTHSPLMELSIEVKLTASKGRYLLAEMAAEVDKNLERKHAELDFLRAQLRQLGIECE